MATNLKCPRCRMRNLPTARFCGRCGQRLADTEPSALPSPQHPDPLKPPEGCQPCGGFPDLFYRWECSWGGLMLSGTETISILLFNAGYPLEEVVVKIRGLDTNQQEVFAVRREIGVLPRGRTLTVEVPSYELPGPACAIGVTVVSGKFGSGA